MNLLDNYKCNQVQEILGETNKKLIIFGKAGTGKTYAMEYLKTELSKVFPISDDHRVMVMFIKATDYLDDMRENLNTRNGNKNIFDKYKNRPVLLLDDLGVESLTDKAEEYLFKLFDERKHITVISTNLTLDEIRARYGTRIFSRMAGDYKFVEFEGDDWRVRNLKVEKAQF